MFAIEVNGMYIKSIKGIKRITLVMTENIAEAESYPLYLNAVNMLSRYGINGKVIRK